MKGVAHCAVVPRLILASSSPYRRAELAKLGRTFEVVPPEVDEGPLQASGLSPSELVRALALAKAQAVGERFPEALVIGSDQCAAHAGRVLGKPGSPEAAVEQLVALSGQTHRLFTAVALGDAASGEWQVAVDEHRLTMRSLTERQIRAYVAADRPTQCAGSYKIESRGIGLFERIEGDDFTAIIGLPLLALSRMLIARGVAVPGPG